MAYQEGFGRNRLQRKHPEARNIPAHGQILGPFATLGKARSGRRCYKADRLSGKSGWPIRPVAFFHRTSRKSRFFVLPAPEAARPWFQSAAAVAAAPANSRTSSNRPACRLRSGRSGRNCQHGRSRPWVTISFAPTQATPSREWLIQASSSVSLARRALFGRH
jgi:hypothetical protein